MNATITYEQTATYHDANRHPAGSRQKNPGARRPARRGILDWLGSISERSGMARRAETFARLNALSDDELRAHGLHRDELLVRCFGGRVLL